MLLLWAPSQGGDGALWGHHSPKTKLEEDPYSDPNQHFKIHQYIMLVSASTKWRNRATTGQIQSWLGKCAVRCEPD